MDDHGKHELRVEPLGDTALVIFFAQDGARELDLRRNARIHLAADCLRRACLPGVVDLVPAFATLTIHYDPIVTLREYEVLAQFQEAVAAHLSDLPEAAPLAPRVREVPVCYGGEYGPDCAELCERLALSLADLAALHSAPLYHVFMIGFQPGFPYLGPLPQALHLPRRKSPRQAVPCGSVAIAGAQTGIYPAELPGGWHLIGRTPLKLFDASRPVPCLLQPGEAVRFIPISADQIRESALP